MMGVAATVLRLLYVSSLQRGLLALGLLLTACGIGAQIGGWHPGAHTLLAVAAILGIMITVISPVVGGPILFRSLAAPRVIQLIPHGRLKMVVGAFCAQLLLSVFIGIALSALTAYGFRNSDPHGAGISCVLAFGGLTWFFLSFSLVTLSRFGFLWMLLLIFVAPRLILFAFPSAQAGEWLVSAKGASIVSMASLMAWMLFGISHVRARRPNLPLGTTVGLGSSPKQANSPNESSLHPSREYSPREALRLLLTGNPNVRLTIVLGVLAMGAVAIVLSVLTGAGHSGRNPVLWLYIFCLFAGILPGVLGGTTMGRRAKSLWLTAGMGRTQLLTAIEMQGWRMLLLSTCAALVVAIPLLVFGEHGDPADVPFLSILAVPLSAGSAFFYVGLVCVRGNRIADYLIMGLNVVLLMAQGFCAAVESQALPSFICMQILLVPVLRQVALRRWSKVDWLLIRQPLIAGRSAI